MPKSIGASRLMDRFVSNAVNRIDAKGRVSVPAHFRALLQKRGAADLYAMRALDMPAMNVGGAELLERYEKRLADEDPFLQSADDMSTLIYADSTMLKLDQDGRIMMTDFVRAHTGITAEVAFVGRGTFFQMWEPTRFDAYLAEARQRLLRLRQPGAAGARPTGGGPSDGSSSVGGRE